MLSVLPQLLTYGLIAPFILRVVLGYIFINLGLLKLTTEKKRWNIFFEVIHVKPSTKLVSALGIIELIGGILLIIGLFTQVAALVLSIFTLVEFYIEYTEETFLKRNVVFYLLILTISLSLIFSGAGFFALDLPL